MSSPETPQSPDPQSAPQPAQQPPQPYCAPPQYGAPVYGPPMPMPINNNLGWAIGSIFVCWPFGIPSLIKSLQVQSLWAQGQYQQAEHSAAEAKKWGKIGIIVGASLLGLYVLLFIAYMIFIAGMIGTMSVSST